MKFWLKCAPSIADQSLQVSEVCSKIGFARNAFFAFVCSVCSVRSSLGGAMPISDGVFTYLSELDDDECYRS